MHDTMVTIRGNISSDVLVTRTSAGKEVSNFSVATSPRVRQQNGSYANGPTSFYRLSCWGSMAHNVAASLAKGMPVVVTGRLRMNEWVGDGGVRRTQAQIDVDGIGPDLARCHAEVRRGHVAPASSDRNDDPAVRSAFAELAGELGDVATGEVLGSTPGWEPSHVPGLRGDDAAEGAHEAADAGEAADWRPSLAGV